MKRRRRLQKPRRRQQRDEAAAQQCASSYLGRICVETQQREGAAAALQQLQWRTKRKKEDRDSLSVSSVAKDK